MEYSGKHILLDIIGTGDECSGMSTSEYLNRGSRKCPWGAGGGCRERPCDDTIKLCRFAERREIDGIRRN